MASPGLKVPAGVSSAITGTSAIKSIEAGYENDVAVGQDGSVWAWGNNLYGQFGNGAGSNGSSPAAVRVSAGEGPSTIAGSSTGNLTNIISANAGSNTVLALSRDGYLYGWGHNGSGEVGNISIGNTEGGNNAGNNNVTRPMLVGARAGNLLQITTAEITAADDSNTAAHVQDSNNAASSTRGKALYYATLICPGEGSTVETHSSIRGEIGRAHV